MEQQLNKDNFFETAAAVENYTLLDDDDVMSAIKVWCNHPDKVLSTLALILKDRILPKVELSNEAFTEEKIMSIKQWVMADKGISEEDARYFVFTDSIKNRAYNLTHFNIKILYKDGQLLDIAKASDQLNIEALTKSVTKYFLCYPKLYTNA